jgi:glucose uptake protein
MYQPKAYPAVLAFMLISMICWGSWANTLKLCRNLRFQLFYWDYLLGLFFAASFWGFTLGSHGSIGTSFAADLRVVAPRNALLALAAGVIFNIANLLLVAAIDVAGLSVAFPIGIGLALVLGALGSFLIDPKGRPILLFGGILLIVAAIILDAVAYRLRESGRVDKVGRRGIVISLAAGLFMGCFYPFVAASMAGRSAPGPYATAMIFVVGVIACAIPFNYLLMRKPLDGGSAIRMNAYLSASPSFHFYGVLGGIIWCTGAVLNFVASNCRVVGPAISYSIGQGATMISACWGVLIWREFAQAPPRSKTYLVWMFVLFVSGLTAVAISPLAS